MRKDDVRFREARRILKYMIKHAQSPEERAYYRGVLNDLNEGLTMFEEALDRAKTESIRMPGFDGDDIGWLPDDFDDDDTMDDEEARR